MDFEHIKRCIALDERRERIENASDHLRSIIADAESRGLSECDAEILREAVEGDSAALAIVRRWKQTSQETGPQGEPLYEAELRSDTARTCRGPQNEILYIN